VSSQNQLLKVQVFLNTKTPGYDLIESPPGGNLLAIHYPLLQGPKNGEEGYVGGSSSGRQKEAIIFTGFIRLHHRSTPSSIQNTTVGKGLVKFSFQINR
jgi:hypothetical protein